MRRKPYCVRHTRRQKVSSMAELTAGIRPPAGRLNATLIHWGAGKTLFRVHRSVYEADQFNDSRRAMRDSARSLTTSAKPSLQRSTQEPLLTVR